MSKILQQLIELSKDMLQEAMSLLTEAVLAKPTQALAGNCGYFSPCDSCGSCGTDKRRYEYRCYDCGACVPGCHWCFQYCACQWC